MSKEKRIIIIGAGLCGSLLAIRMAQRGFKVSLYEKRADMRKENIDAGRSINLALSSRGLMALERVGVKELVLSECIPMNGRMIHPREGEMFFSPYSGRTNDYINSVSRGGLNIALLNKADGMANIDLYFDSKCVNVDLETATVTVKNAETGKLTEETGEVVIGTDGAGSVVRRSMMGRTTDLLFNYSQDFLRHGYKELSILPAEGGGYRIEKNALHIWPRGQYMIIALPNMDGSFTLTMFHPYGGTIGFDNLKTKEDVRAFFEEQYPDLIPFIPHYLDEYFENPVGTLGTIKCYPWQAYGKALIMGDASHAIVPFYGQGMNASFEDVRVFDDVLEEGEDDWEKIFTRFQDLRAANANAIADLAIDNFHEMQDRVDDADFILKRKIEMQLEQQYPDYYSKYSLVTFQPQLSYEEAMNRGRAQDELLLEICKGKKFEEISLPIVHENLMKLAGS